MSGNSGSSEWASLASDEAEEDERKPKFKRNKDGLMQQVGLIYEFDCPECDANNPWADGFKEGDGVSCHYCHQDLLVHSVEGTRVKFKLVS